MKTIVTLEMMQDDEILTSEFTEEAIEALYYFYEWLFSEIDDSADYCAWSITHDWREFSSKSEACKKLDSTWDDIYDSYAVIFIANGVLVMVED